MLQKLRGNSQGFTLIELMIVIAIIGILAAIAIPNFIAYRNKSFCTRAESDANGISATISDYFAIPSHVTTPLMPQLNNWQNYSLSGKAPNKNSGTLVGADPSLNITITVTDASSRCPNDYQVAMAYSSTTPKEDGWIGTSNTYIKYIAP
jgi:prepilin-type N-terminal cleavage/methylation domain-containing protein